MTHPHQDLEEQAAAGATLPGLLWDFKVFRKEPAPDPGVRSRGSDSPRPAPAMAFLDQNLRSPAMK